MDHMGFLSLILSVIAIVVSIKAITVQSKSMVFEKRLSVYCQVELIYNTSKRVLEKMRKELPL